MRVLVTGGTGFIGRAVAGDLVRHGFEVLAMSRAQTGPTFDGREIRHFTGDITRLDRNTDIKGVKTVDSVVHCAGLAHQFESRSAAAFHEVNVLGTSNTIELAATLGAKQFVLASSVSVYGGRKSSEAVTPISEDFDTVPVGPYAQSKLESEVAAKELALRYGMNLVILRFATVIGEGDRGNVARLIRLIDSGRFIWVGDGSNKKSLIYVDDAAQACRLALQNKRSSFEVFNVASGAISMRRIVDRIATALGRRVSRIAIPSKLVSWMCSINDRSFKLKRIEGVSEIMTVWTREDVYSLEKIQKAYGFEPSVDIEDAISREARNIKEQRSEAE